LGESLEDGEDWVAGDPPVWVSSLQLQPTKCTRTGGASWECKWTDMNSGKMQSAYNLAVQHAVACLGVAGNAGETRSRSTTVWKIPAAGATIIVFEHQIEPNGEVLYPSALTIGHVRK